MCDVPGERTSSQGGRTLEPPLYPYTFQLSIATGGIRRLPLAVTVSAPYLADALELLARIVRQTGAEIIGTGETITQDLHIDVRKGRYGVTGPPASTCELG